MNVTAIASRYQKANAEYENEKMIRRSFLSRPELRKLLMQEAACAAWYYSLNPYDEVALSYIDIIRILRCTSQSAVSLISLFLNPNWP